MVIRQRTSRRDVPRRGAGTSGGFALAAMEGLAARAARARDGFGDRTGDGGYGPLRKVERVDAESGFAQSLWLPEGFDFAVFSVAGAKLRGGDPTPIGHGGMACFATGRPGEWRLVRGHGDRNGPDAGAAAGDRRYDPLAAGGTTTLAVGWERGGPYFEEAWRSLSGAVASGAGGATPWGSWLSCEGAAAGTASGWPVPHGYVFEVPSAADGEADPVPLRSMGRFAHAAAAVDPGTGAVYETEDRDTAGFYRFLPRVPGALAAGGALQMLKVEGEWNCDTRTGGRVGRALRAEWVDVDDADPEGVEENPLAVFDQGWAKGAAVFERLGGCFYGGGAVYFASASGGDEGAGQLWEYRPRGDRGGTLQLVFESPDAERLSCPDLVAVSPAGGLVLCEGTRRDLPALRGLTRGGAVFPLVHHEGTTPWRGAAFSPDGRVLFANLEGATTGDPAADQALEPGRTVAIWGPWERGAL